MSTRRRSGRDTKLTGQLGEYLVAAELARRGLIATTFTGNVPHYDIIASDAEGRHVSVQVKTSNDGRWQFFINKFSRISFRGSRQVVGPKVNPPIRRLVVVMVHLGADGRRDAYYICRWQALRDILVREYRDWLRTHGGRRPQNPRSLHTLLLTSSVRRFQDQWSAVHRALR